MIGRSHDDVLAVDHGFHRWRRTEESDIDLAVHEIFDDVITCGVLPFYILERDSILLEKTYFSPIVSGRKAVLRLISGSLTVT